MVWVRLAVVQHGPDGISPLLPEIDADLVILPENWISHKPIPLREYLAATRALASRLGATVLAGVHHVNRDNTIVSAGALAHPDGSAEIVCEKVFPSRSVGERGRVAPGRLLDPRDLLEGLRGSCIACVDIYYPEIARYHALHGALLLVNPASIPADRVRSWNSILSSRAAENSTYVVGANKTGTRYPDGRITGGYSAVYSPDGELLASLGPEPGVLTVTLDLTKPESVELRRGFRSDAAELGRRGFYEWHILKDGLPF